MIISRPGFKPIDTELIPGAEYRPLVSAEQTEDMAPLTGVTPLLSVEEAIAAAERRHAASLAGTQVLPTPPAEPDDAQFRDPLTT